MFVKFKFSESQVNSYLQSAERDLLLADNKEAEIKFQFSYNCLLKLAQAVCASQNLRVKARTGHHIIFFDKCSQLLNNKKVAAVAQTMRDKRNRDLYDGGTVITDKEADVYYKFVKNLIKEVNKYLAINK